MISIATVNGRLLISTTDGANLGTVKGIYLDREVQRGIAVFLGKTGIISRKEHLIDLKHVRLFGIDAWLVEGSDVAVVREEFDGGADLILAENLYGREIQTDGGTRVATIEDVIVDPKFAVLGFSLAKIFIQGPVAEKMSIARGAVSSLGDKNSPMIVSLEQAEKLGIEG
ncbi:MAG: hypothetical protein ABI882_08330 [Acidobacteriota bacterium]